MSKPQGKSEATKISNRTSAHSQNPASLKTKRKGSGKGGWGDPMDDLKYLDTDNTPTTNPNDPNFDEDALIAINSQTLDDNSTNQSKIERQFSAASENTDNEPAYFENFQSDVESLSAFKVKVEELVNDYLWSNDEDKFEKQILELNCSNFFNQIPKVLVWTVITSKKQEYLPPARKLLLYLRNNNLVTKLQLESAFTRLFHRLNELSILNSNAYILLVDFGEYCVARNLMDTTYLSSILKQTEFAKDPQRIVRLKSHIMTIVNEMFSSGDIMEAVRCVSEMETPFYNHEVVKRVISISFDLSNRERELTSQFLAAAVGDGLSDAIPRKTCCSGFLILLQRVEDLYKDVPDVLELLSHFIGRAIVDEVLAPAFVDNVQLLETDMGYAVINHLKHLLDGPRSNTSYFVNIWGVNDTTTSIDEMKLAIHAILNEYLVSRELDEAIAAIQELNISQFHHEIIKQLIPCVSDYTAPDEACDLAIDLVRTCLEHNIISKKQIKKGLIRVRDRLSDYKLDSPKIEKYFEKIKTHFQEIVKLNDDDDDDAFEEKEANGGGDHTKDVEIDAIDIDIADLKKKLAVKSVKIENDSEFKILKCRMRVIAGKQYFLKIQISKTQIIHVFVWKKIDNSIEILKIELEQNESSELVYDRKVVKENKKNDKNVVKEKEKEKKVGGLKDKEIDEIVVNACNSVKDEINKNKKFSLFEAIKCKSQVVAGMNLFVKIKVNKDEYVHARIWCKLDRSFVLNKVIYDQKENDEIEYFE